MNQYTKINEREKNFIKRLEEKNPTLEYLSGYKDSEAKVLLKCKICGDIFERSANRVRGKKNPTCFNCNKLETNKRKEIKSIINKQNKYLKKITSDNNKEIDKIYRRLKRDTLYIKKCVKCNKEYIEHTTSVYCAKCRQTISTKHSNKSLDKLYKRDKGICYICGKECDYNDYDIVDNNFIVGNNYPSIDHYIPISKGGTDDWNNLKLAHFICNTRKSNNMA